MVGKGVAAPVGSPVGPGEGSWLGFAVMDPLLRFGALLVRASIPFLSFPFQDFDPGAFVAFGALVLGMPVGTVDIEGARLRLTVGAMVGIGLKDGAKLTVGPCVGAILVVGAAVLGALVLLALFSMYFLLLLPPSLRARTLRLMDS